MLDLGIVLVLAGGVLIAPAVILFGGAVMRRMVSDDPNQLVGYRTELSMRSRETWTFANQYCGRLWGKLGWVLLFASLAAVAVLVWVITVFIPDPDTVGPILTWIILAVTGAQVACMLASLGVVERQLRRHFNPDGTAKDPGSE